MAENWAGSSEMMLVERTVAQWDWLREQKQEEWKVEKLVVR